MLDRIRKVAITQSALAGSDTIRPADVLEATQYRSLDRELFYLEREAVKNIRKKPAQAKDTIQGNPISAYHHPVPCGGSSHRQNGSRDSN